MQPPGAFLTEGLEGSPPNLPLCSLHWLTTTGQGSRDSLSTKPRIQGPGKLKYDKLAFNWPLFETKTVIISGSHFLGRGAKV